MSYPYISTISGKHYHLLTSDGRLTQESSPVFIKDIAYQLAKINRFTGATTRSYTVAEHSLLCESLADRAGLSPAIRLACLLHDAHEAYLGDVATPIKIAMRRMQPGQGGCSPWDALETMHAQHVATQLGADQSPTAQSWVKKIDLIALAHEKATIGPPDTEPWPSIQGIETYPDEIYDLNNRSDWSLKLMAGAFLDRYYYLVGILGINKAQEA